MTGVVRSFDSVRALDGVECALREGELIALVGGNGSGKSTILRLLAGVLAPDEGAIEVFGADPWSGDAATRMRTGYASQEAALDPEMTGLETLRLFHALRGLSHHDRDELIAHIVDEFGLAEFAHRRIAGYSGGQRQRLHLAIETIHAPRLLLLDEPTASLDPAARASLWARLAAWRAEGRTIVVVTHDIREAERFCDRVIVLQRGRVVADATPAELVAVHGRSRTTIGLTGDQYQMAGVKELLEQQLDRARVTINGATIAIARRNEPSDPDPALELLHDHRIPFARYERQPADLASAFAELTGESLGAPEVRAGRSGRGTGGGRGQRARQE
jgi:ABC-2 type transport system ATP-binding protein